MALSDFAVGAQASIQKLLAERELARRQAIEDEYKRMQEARLTRRMDLDEQDAIWQAEDRAAGRENQRLTSLGTLAEAIPPGEYGESDVMSALSQSPYGALMTKSPAIEAEPMFEGPTPEGEPTGEVIRKGRGALYTKRPTRNQQKDIEAAENTKRDDERAAEVAAETKRHNEAMEKRPPAQGRETFEEWQRKYDYERANPKQTAQALRPATGSERQALAFYNRAKDAVDTIATPNKLGASLEDTVAKSGIGTQLGLQYAPNILQSGSQQSYRQAQRAFTEARLRKESGAAINPTEYENDAKTYFAQPGDKPETVKQKRQMRETVLNGLKFAAGKAYEEFYGEGNVMSADDYIQKYGGR